jgi:DNA-binding IclR family transcriptional regulator
MQRTAVKSASRTLEVLELFQEEQRPLRLNEIYQMLGYPQSSCTNLLKSMVMKGYLNYNRATWTYLPTGKVTALGNWLYGFLFAQPKYQDLLQRVQRETDETVVLATQNDLFIQYVSVVVPSHEFKVPPSEGAMRVMTKSSAGLALMSKMPDRQVDKLCRQIHYYELSNSARLDIEEVMRELRWVRHVGYCHIPNRPTPEAASIAFPLPDRLHGIPLALGVGGLNDRIQRNKHMIVQAMRRAIEEFHAAELVETCERDAEAAE